MSSPMHNRYILLFCIAVLVILIVHKNSSSENQNGTFMSRLGYENQPKKVYDQVVETAKGLATYSELEKNVYEPLGYRIKVPSEPVAELEFIEKPTCKKVMDDWMAIAKTYDEFKAPPKELPEDSKQAFLLFGYSHLFDWYLDNRAKPKPRVWKQIPTWLSIPDDKLGSITNYGSTGLVVHEALKHYKEELKDKRGFVVGSETPWIEVMAIRNGMKHIKTVEYQKTSIEGTDRVSYIHPLEFVMKSDFYAESFDAAISFSSIEHSGLGRYGDPIDPVGDLREVQKIACMLKKNGLLFLGFPRGQDALSYNAHRIYGRIRLSLIFTGFQYLESFRHGEASPIKLKNEDFLSVANNAPQDIHVLRKL